MDWTILGIAPTEDKKAIAAAYRAKLRTTNPEDKPEEFKALRAAYEEAMRLADQPLPEIDDSPVGRWTAKLSALYDDYARRIAPESWQALLSEDVCAALDTRQLIEEALLQFLMEHYYIPRSVWQVLAADFSWVERAEELCEVWSRDFVEQCILNGVRLDPSLTFEHFEPGRDGAACDNYRRLYYECTAVPPEERESLLDRMEALPERHPFGRAMRLSWMLSQGRGEETLAGFRQLAEEYPELKMLQLDYATVSMELGQYDDAERVLQSAVEEDPENFYAKELLADAMAARGALSEAKELLYEVMDISAGDPVVREHVRSKLKQYNELLIEEYKAKPDDAEAVIELSWCYIQNEQLDKALEAARTLDPNTIDAYDYHNLFGKLYHNLEMYAEAAEHLQKAVEVLRNLVSDGTKKTEKRIRRLPEMLQILGSCLMQSGQKDRAKAAFGEALAMAPENVNVLTLMANIHFAAREYEDCIAIHDRLLAVSPGSWFAHLMQAHCFYRLRRDREAFDAVNRGQSLQGRDLNLYILRMLILLRNGAFDEVREILSFLEESGAPEQLDTELIRAELLELADKDTDGAFRMYQSIARRHEEGEFLLDAPALYYRMAMIMREEMDEDSGEDRAILLDQIEKGLEAEPGDEDCMRYKSWLLVRDGRLDEAIEMYRAVHTPAALRSLADLYYEDLDRYAADALAAYEEILADRRTPELCFYAATCSYWLGDLAKAEHYARLAIEMDEADMDAWRVLAFLAEYRGDQQQALAYIDTSAKHMWEAGVFYEWLISHQIKDLCRLGRSQEALKLIGEAMDRADYPGGYQAMFDVCAQFGLWERAEEVLKEWSAARPNDPEQRKATGRLHLLRGRMLKATIAYGKVKHSMTEEEERDLRIQLCELEANHKRVLQLRKQMDGDQDQSHVLVNQALAFFWNGQSTTAAEISARGLIIVDALLDQFQVDEPMYRTRRSVFLALMGRMDEAREELERARNCPLCKYCTYGRCKDADIYEAYIEEIAGNRAKALELYRAGQKNWPDELDFRSGEIRLKKKKG